MYYAFAVVTIMVGLGSIGFTSAHPARECIRIGHRGAAGHEPENTLRSFQKALDCGVDMIELDVHLSASGDLIVIHDATLERTTNGHGNVHDYTTHELTRYDAGDGEYVPTLEQVIALVNKRVIINIELKGDGTDVAVANLLLQYIAQGWDPNLFLVSSFDHTMVLRFHELLSAVPVSALLEGIPVTLAAYAHDCGAQAIGIYKESISQAYIDDAHARGLKVYVYTVDSPDEIAQIKAMGVDGIFSNYPDRL